MLYVNFLVFIEVERYSGADAGILKRMGWRRWVDKLRNMFFMNHYNPSVYTGERCIFDRQYFYYFNSFSMSSFRNNIKRPRFLIFKWAL